MVEVKLEYLDGSISGDAYMFVRIGEVQKLSKLSAEHTYKFPQSAIGDRHFGKVEIFNRIVGCNVDIIPGEHDQEVSLPVGNKNVKFRVQVSSPHELLPGTTEPKSDKSPPQKVNPKVLASQQYLEKHNLQLHLSQAVQAVLRDMPEDPALFVANELIKSAGVVTKVPKARGQTATSAPALAKPQVCSAAPPPVAKSAPVTGATPFLQYYKANFISVPEAALANIYAQFNLKPHAAAPAAASADVLAAEAEKTEWATKPSVGTWYCQKVERAAPVTAVVPFAKNHKANCVSLPAEFNIKWQAEQLAWATKPSVGTWYCKKPVEETPAAKLETPTPLVQSYKATCISMPEAVMANIYALFNVKWPAGLAATAVDNFALLTKPSVGTWYCKKAVKKAKGAAPVAPAAG